MSVNKVILIGNVGKAPDVKHLDNGNTVANFTLATSEKFKKQDGTMTTVTEWHSIVVWGRLAEVIEKHVKKGQQLYLSGKIATRSYEKDGAKRYVTEIIANEMSFVGQKQESNSGSNSGQEAASNFNQPQQVDISDNSNPFDLPF